MIRKTTVLKLLGIALFLAMTFLAVDQAIVDAQDCRIVRIWGRAEPIIEPPIALVPKGTCIIWLNNNKAEVKIIFEEGKKCQDVTDAATGFSLDSSSCFVTTWLKYGATSSLRFNEAGTYKYMVEYEGMKKRDEGRIVVE